MQSILCGNLFDTCGKLLFSLEGRNCSFCSVILNHKKGCLQQIDWRRGLLDEEGLKVAVVARAGLKNLVMWHKHTKEFSY